MTTITFSTTLASHGERRSRRVGSRSGGEIAMECVAPEPGESNEMTTSMPSFNHGLSAHPLYRLATEAPEQLEPCLRRAAFAMARRRFAAWLGAAAATSGRTSRSRLFEICSEAVQLFRRAAAS